MFEEFLESWTKIIISAIACFGVYAYYTRNSNNDWNSIPRLLRIPLVLVATNLAGLGLLLCFIFVRFVPSALEFIGGWIFLIIGFFGGVNVEPVGVIVEKVMGYIGDIIVSPYFIFGIYLVSTFPVFYNDKVRTIIYRLITLSVITFVLLHYFIVEPTDELDSFEIIIYVIEVILGSLFSLRMIFDDYKNGTV